MGPRRCSGRECRRRSRPTDGHEGQHPRSGAPPACGRDEPVRHRLHGQRRRPDHEGAAIREDHHSEFGRRHGASVDGGYAHYGAAKAAIAHYTRYLAQDLGPFGITANCIAPGVIATGRIMATVIPGSSPEQPRPIRVGRPAAARDGRGLRQGGRVPRDRPVRLCDRRGHPDRRRAGKGVVIIRL